MATWQELYKQSKDLYRPHEVSPFVYSHHVVAAIEAEDGQVFTGVCFEATAGVLHLCAERMAAVNMYMASGQTKIKKSWLIGTNRLMVQEQVCLVGLAESSFCSYLWTIGSQKSCRIMTVKRR
jgi:cytidine deaminase